MQSKNGVKWCVFKTSDVRNIYILLVIAEKYSAPYRKYTEFYLRLKKINKFTNLRVIIF